MRYILFLTICALVLMCCKSDTVGPNSSQSTSGRSTLDSMNGFGFSFARGTPQHVPISPAQDSVDDFDGGYVETGDDPTPIGLCLVGFTEHTFHLVAWYSTLDSARAFFQSLAEITDTNFIRTTCAVTISDPHPKTKANQIWSVHTRQDKFAKMLIVSDTSISNHLHMTFDWVYQPSGSRRF